MSKPRGVLKALAAVAILILGAGCSQSPTAPEALAPTGAASSSLYSNGGG